MIAAEPDSVVFACDLRGIGESKPVISTPGKPAKDGVDYFHAGCGLMFNYPMPGQRTHDLLRVIALLRDSGHREVHVVARVTALRSASSTSLSCNKAANSLGPIGRTLPRQRRAPTPRLPWRFEAPGGRIVRP